MEKFLQEFKLQFQFKPVIENLNNFKGKNKFLIVGMGGSHLAADLLKITHPFLDLTIISDFNLPQLSDLLERKIILISYSGNTLETINALQKLERTKIKPLMISANGLLLARAKINKYPYIELPEKNLPPRLAIGYLYLSLLKAINDENSLKKISGDLIKFNFSKIQKRALTLSLKLKGKIPIIYSSFINYPLAYNFKIRFNETAKIPAFCHYLPEANHNEIQGFYRLKKIFYFLLLEDKTDSKELIATFKTIKKFLKDKKFFVESLTLDEKDVFKKIFSAIHLADLLSFYLAKIYKLDPLSTPFIDEIKKRLKI